MNYTFGLPAILSFILTFSVIPLVIKLANKYGLVDDPKHRRHPAHTHKGVIPRAGGLAIYLGIMIPSLLFLPINKALIGILLAGLLTTLIGLWDDKKDLSPHFRLVANILTALLVVGAGIGIPYITNPLGGVVHLDTLRISFTFLGNHSILVLADILAVLWIVWTMNIVGWSSGVDGQMPGFVAIAASVLGIMSWRFSAHDISQSTVATLAFVTAGAYLGFLPWNFYPQKIMPGYGGKSLAGFMLATIAILSGGKIGSAVLILAIPMLDATYSVIRRLINHKSLFQADRYHLHHRLLDLGWGKRRIALFYWGISAILGMFTLIFNNQQKWFVFISVTVVVCGVLYWLSGVLRQPKKTEIFGT